MPLQVISLKQTESQDEEPIISFSESKPVRPVEQPSRKELKDAEDQNTDKEEEKKDEDKDAPGANEVKQPENPDVGVEESAPEGTENGLDNSTDLGELGGASSGNGTTENDGSETTTDLSSDTSDGSEGVSEETQEDGKDDSTDGNTARMLYNSDDLVHTQFDIDTLMSMPPENLAEVRFMPRTMDYGTPAGGDSHAPEPGSCPACGDAADAAIIDASIAPDEDSEEPGAKEETEARDAAAVNGENESGGDFGNTGGVDFGGDFELLSRILTARRAQETKTDFFHGALESYSHDYLPIDTSAGGLWNDLVVNGVGTILKLAGFLLVKVVKVANTIYKNCRDLIAKMFVKKELIAKFMNIKLNALIKSIDEERFNAYELTAYPRDKWEQTAKVALMMFDNAMHAKELTFERSPQIVTPKIKKIIDTMEHCGIKINIKRTSVNIDDNLDSRQHETVANLGYSVREIPNLLRYFEELSKRVPNGSKNQLEVVSDIVIKQLGSLRKELDEKIKSKKISADEAKAQEELLVAYSARADFCLLLQKGCYMLFSQLFDDMFTLCTKIENAIEAQGLQRIV